MSRISKPLPTWDEMLTAACRFQELVPGAVLGGGCAVILHAGHRMSHDADYSMRGLEHNFDEIQNILESNSDWKTNYVAPPSTILGQLLGVKTSVKQMTRSVSLDTVTFEHHGMKFIAVTAPEMIKSKCVAIVNRNIVRDYVDLAALIEYCGPKISREALF